MTQLRILMIHSPVPLVAFSLFCLVSTGSAQGPAAPQITPIRPSAGNTEASAPPKAPPKALPQAPPKAAPPVAKPAEPMKYLVRAGDNPWKIAKNHGISLEELLAANEIKDSKKLAIGDILLLPVGVESKGAPVESKPTPAAAAATAPSTPAPVAGDNWEHYTIKSGDNPWSIAKRLKVDHQKILSLNEGLDFTNLKIGQQIKVPKKSQ